MPHDQSESATARWEDEGGHIQRPGSIAVDEHQRDLAAMESARCNSPPLTGAASDTPTERRHRGGETVASVTMASDHMNHGENDRSSLRSWHEWQLEGRDRRIVFCVATGLELRPGYPGFDTAKLDALISEVNEMARASPSPIDFIRIVPEP